MNMLRGKGVGGLASGGGINGGDSGFSGGLRRWLMSRLVALLVNVRLSCCVW